MSQSEASAAADPAMQQLVILGATGSIGESTLDVVSRHPERFNVLALSGHRNVERLAQQCLQFRPTLAVVADAEAAAQLESALKASNCDTDVQYGSDALNTAASLPDATTVMAAIVGAAGMPSALAAARSGKRLLLANKEALVLGGALFMQAVSDNDAELVPIDSEHNAIFQCLPQTSGRAHCGDRPKGVSRLLLTASGGPFRERSIDSFESITVEEAVAHPNWSMGQKISVDSATMMNKGLELIEARWLFDMPASDIQVVVHPQSVIHSLVQYVDGSVLAELGNPDMRTPIAHALGMPERIDAGVEPLDLFDVARMDFVEPDMRRYPCLQLAYDALDADPLATAVLNAANEVSVEAFLQRRIGYGDIARINHQVLNLHVGQPEPFEASWDQLLAIDESARRTAAAAISGLSG